MDPTDDGDRDDDEEALVAREVARRERRRRSRGGGVADVIGGAIVGFDYQVFRATKQPAILVESAKPVRGLSGQGGARLSIGYPDDLVDPDPSPAGDPPAAPEPGLR